MDGEVHIFYTSKGCQLLAHGDECSPSFPANITVAMGLCVEFLYIVRGMICIWICIFYILKDKTWFWMSHG